MWSLDCTLYSLFFCFFFVWVHVITFFFLYKSPVRLCTRPTCCCLHHLMLHNISLLISILFYQYTFTYLLVLSHCLDIDACCECLEEYLHEMHDFRPPGARDHLTLRGGGELSWHDQQWPVDSPHSPSLRWVSSPTGPYSSLALCWQRSGLVVGYCIVTLLAVFTSNSQSSAHWLFTEQHCSQPFTMDFLFYYLFSYFISYSLLLL